MGCSHVHTWATSNMTCWSSVHTADEYIHVNIHTHMHTYAHTHVQMFTYMHVGTYTYTYTYTHIHIHMHACRLEELSGGHALVWMAEAVIRRFGLVDSLRLNPRKLRRCDHVDGRWCAHVDGRWCAHIRRRQVQQSRLLLS